jgi:hypothetical protein
MDFSIKEGLILATELLSGGATTTIVFKYDSLDFYKEGGIDSTIVSINNYVTTISIDFTTFNNSIRAVIRQKNRQ